MIDLLILGATALVWIVVTAVAIGVIRTASKSIGDWWYDYHSQAHMRAKYIAEGKWAESALEECGPVQRWLTRRQLPVARAQAEILNQARERIRKGHASTGVLLDAIGRLRGTLDG